MLSSLISVGWGQDCDEGYTEIDGECYYQSDLDVLQQFIDNSLNSEFVMENCYENDPWCASPNLFMDGNNNGIVEPLELGLQDWIDGRLTSWMCGAYIYCNLSGEIPNSVSELTEITTLRLELNYFTGFIPESVCELEHIDYDDNLSIDFSYNQLCPPYPDCIDDISVHYMDTSACPITGDINADDSVDILDVVMLVSYVLSGDTSELDGADINNDGAVNVIDVVILVDIILNP